jgi:hypothetical protein
MRQHQVGHVGAREDEQDVLLLQNKLFFFRLPTKS